MTEPTNKNFLSPLGFDFRVKKLPTTNFFVTRVAVPGFSLGVVESPTPFVRMPVPGDKIQFNDLQVTFKIDEDMKNYLDNRKSKENHSHIQSFHNRIQSLLP